MSIVEAVAILEHQLFLQRDARDPLGIWVARHAVTGDASVGTIKVNAQVPAERAGSRIYTCYYAQVAGVSGTLITAAIKHRLLSNLPDADILPGVRGFATLTVQNNDGQQWNVSSGLSAPIAGPFHPQVTPLERFILLFGNPGQDTDIAQLEISDNVNLAGYIFEWYGYFWDREVLYAAGGPRHPGSD